MKRIFLFIAMLPFLAASVGNSVDAANCSDIPLSLHKYTVYWHWGMVKLNAGNADVSYQCDNGNFYGTLSGHSIEWEGRIYCIGDTLQARMEPTVENVGYINGVYRKPLVGEPLQSDNPAQYKSINGAGELSASDGTMETVDLMAQMINMFYYSKALDYASMEVGAVTEIPINMPDGSREMMRLTYHGTGPSNYCQGDVYNLTLLYTYKGQISSYPIECEVSVDSLIPVLISSNIKIGHVQMALAEP